MIKPPLSHAVLALAIMGVTSVVTLDTTAGMMGGIFFYYGREVAQRQQEIADILNTPRSFVWRQGWNPFVWEKGKLDLLYPVLSCVTTKITFIIMGG